MSREDGFAVADVSTSLLEDPKVRALWRRLRPDSAAMCQALHLHEAVLLASWRLGERVTADDAAPAWIPDPASVAAHLVAVRLLDAHERLPLRSWRQWVEPAIARRDTLRERWRRANKSRQRGDDADTARLPLPPVRQDSPTDRPPRARARLERYGGPGGPSRPHRSSSGGARRHEGFEGTQARRTVPARPARSEGVNRASEPIVHVDGPMLDRLALLIADQAGVTIGAAEDVVSRWLEDETERLRLIGSLIAYGVHKRPGGPEDGA